MRYVLPAALAVLFLSAAFPASASFTAQGTDTRQVLAEQKQIRNEVESPRGKYSRFNERAQVRLRAAQERIFALLEGGRTLEQLNKEEQVQLLNAVEEVEAVLADNEQDKLECWRESKLGSKLKVTRCETVATRERIREEARLWKSDVGACQMGESGAPECGPPRKPRDVGY